MARPFLLAHLSDPHLGEPPILGVRPKKSLRQVIAAMEELPNPIDAILVTGDLAEHGKLKEYRLAGEMLAGFGVPVLTLPGNHDDRATMRKAFAIPGTGDAPIDYAVDLGPLRVVVVDSTIPGEDHGGFDPAQLEWLDAELAAAPAQPTILAMHQPPLATGIPDWDRVNMSVAERQRLAAVVERHPQVRAILGGHLHRVAASTLAGRPVLVAPSAFVQARPNFETEKVKLRDISRGFLLHVVRGEELASQAEIVAGPEA